MSGADRPIVLIESNAVGGFPFAFVCRWNSRKIGCEIAFRACEGIGESGYSSECADDEDREQRAESLHPFRPNRLEKIDLQQLPPAYMGSVKTAQSTSVSKMKVCVRLWLSNCRACVLSKTLIILRSMMILRNPSGAPRRMTIASPQDVRRPADALGGETRCAKAAEFLRCFPAVLR
jgi:hypothetical protein